MTVSRTLIAEIIGGVIALAVTTMVGNLYMQVQDNKDQTAENRDAIKAAVDLGHAEVRRSSDVDETQKEDIIENKIEINQLRDKLNRMDREIGEVKRDVHHAHKEME